MALFNEKEQDQLKNVLQNMQDKVTLVFFTQEFECTSCKDTHQFVDEIASLSNKIEVKAYEFVQDDVEREKYNVDKVPAIVLLDKDDKYTGMTFYGLPGGYEINSFLASVLEVAGQKQDIAQDVLDRIQKIGKEIHIQVFVSLGCPHCPGAVTTAHTLAKLNSNIRADMVETSTFPYLSNKYAVSGVPKIIINEEYNLLGNQPISSFLDIIEKI